MSYLSNSVFGYYNSHFDDLPADKQFHFASRTYLWHQLPGMRERLDALRGWCIPNEKPAAMLESLAHKPVDNSLINAAALRGPLLQRYPHLQGYNAVLFRMLFMRTIYGVETSGEFLKLFDRANVLRARDELLGDNHTLAILSTYAINFLFLLEHIVLHEGVLPLEQILRVGRSQYDTDDPLQLQLLVYLYTHCIIADTHFYYRAVPGDNRAIYLDMLKHIEQLIEAQFANVHLDNKFEFLVCCTIIGHESTLRDRIMHEAEQSVSNDGTFLVDRHNTNGQAAKRGFDTSEHRNVLFILANQPFSPLAAS